MAKQILFLTAALCVLGYVVSTSVSADTIFYDDFNDGDAADGKPVTWVPLPTTQGTFDASSGDYVLSPQIQAIGASVRNVILPDVSIRAQARISKPTSPGSAAELVARIDYEAQMAYVAGIDEEGTVYISRGNESLASAGTELRPIDEDVMMQFDVFGTSLNMWAWRPEEQMPSAPLIIATDNRLARGEAGVHYYSFQPSSMLGSAIFRFVHVADMHIPIPEPSTLGISVFSLLGLMRYRDRRP